MTRGDSPPIRCHYAVTGFKPARFAVAKIVPVVPVFVNTTEPSLFSNLEISSRRITVVPVPIVRGSSPNIELG